MSPSVRCAVRLAVTLAAWSTVVPGSAAAQWRVSARLWGSVQYDANPFLLDSAHARKLGLPSAADSVSGRFREMPDVRDVIPIMSLELSASTSGLLGHPLALGAAAGYEANIMNSRRRHAELGLAIEQALSRADRVRLTIDWVPSYFFKNYLADVIDTDGDRLITPDERRYAAGVYNETGVGLEYRRRLLSAKDHPFGLTAGVRGGYVTRTYDAPFRGRDRKGPEAGGSLGLDLGRRWTLGLDYTYTKLDADTSREVEILDEVLYGVDFNANGTTSDPNALARELVDESRQGNEFGVSLDGKLSDAVSVQMKYGRRNRDFTSTQPYDAAHLNRSDHRNSVVAKVAVQLVPAVELRLQDELIKQTTNRAGDPGSIGEEAAYTRQVVTVAMRCRFGWRPRS